MMQLKAWNNLNIFETTSTTALFTGTFISITFKNLEIKKSLQAPYIVLWNGFSSNVYSAIKCTTESIIFTSENTLINKYKYERVF